jgi:RimJ/RimL family protein N-acetyltransferase
VVSIPTLTTPRLTLRPIAGGDLDAFAAIWADPEFAEHIGGPCDRHDAWHAMIANVGVWALEGVGPWAVAERRGGAVVGRAGLWNEPGWPGVEAVWFIGRPWWGRGYATEAATAAITYAFGATEADQVVSVILPANVRSLRVAERLRMRFHHMEYLHETHYAVYVIGRREWATAHP